MKIPNWFLNINLSGFFAQPKATPIPPPDANPVNEAIQEAIESPSSNPPQ